MMSDLNVVDFLYAVIGMFCFIGLLIYLNPPDKPVSVRTRHRIRIAQERKEAEQ